MATVREETRAQIWVVPIAEPDRARAVPTTTGRTDGSSRLVWLGDETIVYGAPDEGGWNLWRVDAEGGTSARITSMGAASPASALGERLVFNAGWGRGEGAQGVYALELDGGEPSRLSPEGRFANRPAITPDGEWVFYELLTGERMKFVRSPWAGGEPKVVTEAPAHLASFSPDGSRVALHVRYPDIGRWQTAIFPVDGVPGETLLDIHSESYSPWASDDSLYIARSTDRVANIFRVNVDDGSEEQVTFFSDQQIFSFDVSPDLTRLAVGRGEVVNDLLLIEGLFAQHPR